VVATERASGTRLHAREVAAAAGISQRRAYELLRAVRAEDAEEQAP
jgi:sugar-specific transcriptional regulator TrmB